MGDPNAQTNAQMQAQLQQAQMAQRQAQMQAQMQVGQMGGMHAPPVVLIPGQPVTTAQMAAQARPPPAEMTLAQMAAQQHAEAAAKKTAKAKKTPKAKAAKKDAVGAGTAPMQTQPAAPAQTAAQQHVPQRVRPQGAPVPLRQQDPADIVSTLKTNLDLIRREFAENLAAAAARGEEFQPPSFQVRSQHDAAVGIELWLQNHAANFNADELQKKVAMLRHIQDKCRTGRLDPINAQNKIEALACWVELTKTYYICARESRNLKLRGVRGITSPTFRLPDTTKQIPPPRPPEDFGSVAELDVAMGAVCGAQTWVAAVEKHTAR
jgi:hypothetical protein